MAARHGCRTAAGIRRLLELQFVCGCRAAGGAAAVYDKPPAAAERAADGVDPAQKHDGLPGFCRLAQEDQTGGAHGAAVLAVGLGTALSLLYIGADPMLYSSDVQFPLGILQVPGMRMGVLSAGHLLLYAAGVVLVTALVMTLLAGRMERHLAEAVSERQ